MANKEWWRKCFGCVLALVAASPSLCPSIDRHASFHIVAQGQPDSAKPTARKSLEIAVKQFVAALKDRDVEALIQQFSKNGVVFGIDSDPISFQLIRKQMRKGGPLYCSFFDTQCLRQEPGFEKQFSLRDSLVNGKAHHWQLGINQQAQPTVGDVRLFVEGNPDRSKTGNEFCNLSYKFEHGAWKIREVVFY
jgi:hypothetical protein